MPKFVELELGFLDDVEICWIRVRIFDDSRVDGVRVCPNLPKLELILKVNVTFSCLVRDHIFPSLLSRLLLHLVLQGYQPYSEDKLCQQGHSKHSIFSIWTEKTVAKLIIEAGMRLEFNATGHFFCHLFITSIVNEAIMSIEESLAASCHSSVTAWHPYQNHGSTFVSLW